MDALPVRSSSLRSALPRAIPWRLGAWVRGASVLGAWVLGAWVLGAWVLGACVLGACAPPPPADSAPSPPLVAAPEDQPAPQGLEPDTTAADDDAESDMVVTESGLGIEDLVEGDGEVAEEGSRVSVHYVGRLEDGKVFDTSERRGPYLFELGRGDVIAGWDEGVLGMKVGGKRRLTVPAKLAYGAQGQPPNIPPNALLEFEIELVSVE